MDTIMPGYVIDDTGAATSTTIPSYALDEIDTAAFLDGYVYLDAQSPAYQNLTLNEIYAATLNSDAGSEAARINDFLGGYIGSNPSYGDIKLVSQSTIDGKIPFNLLVSCAFEDPQGTVFVAFRGTGDGRWVDNGVAMNESSSLMQRMAAVYFDHVIESNGYHQTGNRIVDTGHSKGGNNAQYSTLFSKYGYLVDRCISIDGQGFSTQAIRELIAEKGQDYYDAQTSKMISINGENDFVHDLGNVIIDPSAHTIFVATPGAEDIGGYHHLEEMISDFRLNWLLDENGNAVSIPQGPIGRFARELSHVMMTLNEEDLEDCSLSIMTILEHLMGDTVAGSNYKLGQGDVESASLEEIIGFMAQLPIILQTVNGSEGVREYIADLYKEKIQEALESEYPESALTQLFLLTPLIALAVMSGELLLYGLSVIASVVELFLDTISFLGDGIKKIATSFCEAIKNFAENAKEWFNSTFNAGYVYATSEPEIIADTAKMKSYAERLEGVNRRLERLDNRIDRVYWQVGLADLLSLMKADYKIGKSVTITKAASYLKTTAEEFEAAEREMMRKLK